MKRVVFLAVFLGILIQANSFGQTHIYKNLKALEVYGGIGSTHYFGDVGGSSNGKYDGLRAIVDNFGLDIEQTKYGGMVGFRYIPNNIFAISTQVAPLLISGSDQNSHLEERGYSFFTYVVETSARAELFISRRVTGFAPYIFTGFSGLIYNAKDRQHQKWSGVSYGSNILVGFGARLPSKNHLTHALEVGFRYCFQDDIDLMPGLNLVGDTYYLVAYIINMDLNRTFIYDSKGRINK